MSRLFALGLVLVLSAPAAAADPAEKMLSPTTQLYLRWDGVTPHAADYKNSVLGALWAGTSGDSLRALLAQGPKQLGAALLADPLLDGKPPEELRTIHADLKSAGKLLELIADKGLIVAAEVREPRPTLAGVGKALGNLLGGGAPPTDALMPDAQLLVIVPDAGDRCAAIFSALRLLTQRETEPLEKLPAEVGREGFTVNSQDKSSAAKVGWWKEGTHFVLYVGTSPIDRVVKAFAANSAAGGMTNHPLLDRCSKCAKQTGFTSVARGFIDTGSVVGLAKRLAGPFVPGLSQRLDALGVGGLKSLVFSSGFNGKESRAVWELDMPGERQGFAKMIKGAPLTLADLPPLPPDVTRFSMLRVNPAAAYDALLGLAETVGSGESLGVEDGVSDFAEVVKRRKAYIAREVDKFVGIAVKDDLLPHLGDKVVIYQSPTEGLSVFGTVLCLSVKDGPKVKVAMDRMQRIFESAAGGPMKVRKKMIHGVEVRELYGRGFNVVTPTYAVVGDWLVLGGNPQVVHGLVMRSKGALDAWKPDAGTAKRLAGMGADAVGIQYCDPRGTAQNLCTVGPLFLATVGQLVSRGNDGGDFDPIDVGLVPNSHELTKHLFPNLTVTRDDGKTLRVEVNESLSLPARVPRPRTAAVPRYPLVGVLTTRLEPLAALQRVATPRAADQSLFPIRTTGSVNPSPSGTSYRSATSYPIAAYSGTPASVATMTASRNPAARIAASHAASSARPMPRRAQSG